MPSPILASTARELSSDCWTREGALSRLGLASILSSRSAPSPRSSPRLHGAADVWLPLGLPAGARRRPDLRVLEPRHGSVGPRPRPQVEDELRAARNAPHSHATRHERNRDHAHAYAAGATATDLMTFVVANLDSAATPLSRTLQQTHGERHATNDPNLKIGLAWHILLRPAGKIVWHKGGTGGYRSFIGFDPARRIGVVVLCNNGNENVDDIGFHVLDEMFPLTEVAVDSLVLQRYVGDYELAPTFHIVITREAAHLFAQATAQPRFPIFAESDSTFFLTVVDAQLTFRPDGLVLHQNGQQIPGRKVHEEGEAPVGIEPTNRGFADLCLTTWLRRQAVKSHQKRPLHQVRGASQHTLIVR